MNRGRLLVAPVAVAAVVTTAFLVGDGDEQPDVEAVGETAGTPPREPPQIVSAEEFCAGFGDLAIAQEAQLSAASTASVATLKDAATRVGELAEGTAMPATARAGVDYVVTAFTSLPDDATAQDVVESDDAATVTDDAHAQALAAYLGENCRRSPLSSAQ